MAPATRMYTVTPQQAAVEIAKSLSCDIVPLLTSSPGMGKSSMVRQIAKDYRLKLIDLRLSQCTPEDLQGFPMRTGDKASFVPFDMFPLETDEVPKGYEGWLLFLDELTSATKLVQGAAYKLILDKMVGSFRLHPRVAMVAAGNKITDKAVVNQLSTALQSRVTHYEMDLSLTEFTEYAYETGLDSRIIAFVNYRPTKLMDFRPDHTDVTFPCPRTWEFLSRLIQGDPVTEASGPRVSAAIGEGTAVEFITFVKEFDRLPKYEQIVNDPLNTPVPAEASTKYAAICMLAEAYKTEDLDNILVYIDRFSIEMQVIFGRGAVARNPSIRHAHPGFAKFITKMVKYLE